MQDGTVNSFQIVQRKQTFIWNIGIESLEANDALQRHTCSLIAKLCKKLYFTLLTLLYHEKVYWSSGVLIYISKYSPKLANVRYCNNFC